MEILNRNGLVLMDYRREFKRHYAESVDEALKESILSLYKAKQIPEKLFRILLDESVDDSVVYTYLLSRREFTKSSVELNSEFDEIREKVNACLLKIGFVKNVCTKNSINTNRIFVIKQYDVSKSLLLAFFGLNDQEVIPLMNRKGFMDKFCVLRLSQVFKAIYSELNVPENIDHGYSLIYYNKATQGFSVDYKYMVSISVLNNDDKLLTIMNQIKNLDEVVQKKFENKMNYSYFRLLEKKAPMEKLLPAIEKVVVPVRTGKSSKDIRKPELIIDDVQSNQEQGPTIVENSTTEQSNNNPKQDKPNNKKNKQHQKAPNKVNEPKDDNSSVSKSDDIEEQPTIEAEINQPTQSKENTAVSSKQSKPDTDDDDLLDAPVLDTKKSNPQPPKLVIDEDDLDMI